MKSHILQKNVDTYLRFFILVGFIVGICVFGWNNLNDPNFWLDESWQFESSHGISLGSPAMTPVGSLKDILKQNQIHNGDPGGFSALIYLWSLVSTTPFWLRLLPYLFFLISLYYSVKIAGFFISSKTILCFLPLFLFPVSFVFRYGNMLRPYSMELCGLSIVVFLLFKLQKESSQKIFWVLGFVGAFFLTSRYSFALAYFAGICTLLIVKFKLSIKEFIKSASGAVIPPVIMGIIIYVLSFRFHITIPFGNHAPYLLHGQSLINQLKIFQINFLSLLALPTSIFMIVMVIQFSIYAGSKKNIYNTALALWIMIVEILFVICSYLGYVPWYINERWSLAIQYASVISTVALIGYVYSFLEKRIKKRNIHVMTIFALVFIYGIILAIICGKKGDMRESMYGNFLSRGDKIYVEKYYINYNAIAIARYLFEYGPLKKYSPSIYPSHFIFETAEENKEAKLIDTSTIDIVLISHEIPAHYLPRFSNPFKEITVYKPSHMLQKIE